MTHFISGSLFGFIGACAVFYWMIKVTADNFAKDGHISFQGKTYIFRESFEMELNNGNQ